MEFMFFEVVRAEEIQRRQIRYASVNRVENVDWMGEPIASGDSVVIHLYPTVTRSVDGVGSSTFTFTEPGRYQLRVAYSVPDYFKNLWQPSGGTLYSNYINLDVREAAPQEKEILDAYWSGEQLPLMMGEDNFYLKADEAAIRDVLSRYPDNPLCRYVMFALARTILTTSWANDAKRGQGMALLAELHERYPSFRTFEVALHMGTAQALGGDKVGAVDTLGDGLTATPELIDNPKYMDRLFQALALSGNLTSRQKRDWYERRAAGDKWSAVPQRFVPAKGRDN
jgi:hypothetical protein